MPSAVRTLKRLVKINGPIKTFYISLKGAAYTELKFVEIHRNPRVSREVGYIKYKGYVRKTTDRTRIITTPPKEIVTNKIVGEEVYIEQAYKAEAAKVAIREGRIQSPCIGEPSENDATSFLLRIAARAEYRLKYRALFAKFIKETRIEWHARRLSMPDPRAPDTLGWRIWHWDHKAQRLKSPTMNTIWHTPELIVPHWDIKAVVRGFAGIHAARMPYDWRRASLEGTELNGYTSPHPESTILGVVERFGKYVLGTEGWRAEWVIIRALKAPSTEIGLLLEKAYPDVEVFYDEE
jgi:hypothetical protein